MKLSVVIPIYNEESVLEVFYRRLTTVLAKTGIDFEMVFVNDGSQDQSLAVLLRMRSQDPRVKIVEFSRNFGHQIAITAGLDHATGDATVIMDGDLQHPPELIPELLARWKDGFWIVTPIKSRRSGEGLFKRLSARGFYSLIQHISDVHIAPEASDFRLLDRRVVEILKHCREHRRFLRGLSAWMGFKQATLTYTPDERYAGSTKFSLLKMLRLGLDGVTSFSVVPLELASYLGFLVSFLGGLYALYALYIRLFTSEAVPGWTSLMIIVTFLGGIQLLALGIFGEYLGRIYEEVKRRPLYVVREIYK